MIDRAIAILEHVIGWAIDRLTLERRQAEHGRRIRELQYRAVVERQFWTAVYLGMIPRRIPGQTAEQYLAELADLQAQLEARLAQIDRLKVDVAALQAQLPTCRPLFPLPAQPGGIHA